MSKQKTAQPQYMVGVYDEPHVCEGLRFTFVPQGPQQAIASGEAARHQYIVSVRGRGDGTLFEWISAPQHEDTKRELEEIARKRMTDRYDWLDKLRTLVATVKGWAENLGWATKVVEKKMEDAEIGNYKAPALLLQEETIRLFLEPVARSAPGTEGVVDLYLMPSYDDIASLYYYNDQWNVHYMFQGTPTVGNIREAESKPLSELTLQNVFDEMKANAG